MTPAASTAAGRRAPVAPRSPRRVSGPVRGRVAVPAAPRVRRSPRPYPAPSLGWRVLARIRALPDHALLDRLVRGRAWIPILGVMLAGIVAMQVEVLKLGSSMGRSIERGSSLSSRNQELRASVAALGDDQRIESLAAGMGMVMPDPTTLRFLVPRPGADTARALHAIHAPDATQFLASLPVPTTALTGTTAATTSTAMTTSATVSTQGAAVTPTTGTATPAAQSTAAATTTSTSAATPATSAVSQQSSQSSTSTTGGAAPAAPGG